MSLIKLVQETLDEAKAVDILHIDVRHLTTMADDMVFCSAQNTRHSRAIANRILKAVRKSGIKSPRVEGMETGYWVLLDLNGVLIHIMLPEAREHYALEELWGISDEKTK